MRKFKPEDNAIAPKPPGPSSTVGVPCQCRNSPGPGHRFVDGCQSRPDIRGYSILGGGIRFASGPYTLLMRLTCKEGGGGILLGYYCVQVCDASTLPKMARNLRLPTRSMIIIVK